MHRSLAAALMIAALAAPALAQDRPPLRPTRDVSVTYRTLGREAGHTVVMSQSAASGKMRVESDRGHGYAIVDRAAHRTTVVMEDQHMYLERDGTGAPGQPGADMPDGQASFRRGGTDTVAGTRCTVWQFTDRGGRSGTACITDDGVMLRALNRNGEGLEATRVTYGPQPADRFEPPAGFRRMELPAGIGAPGGARPGAAGGLPPGISLPPGVHLPPGVSIPARP